MFKRKRSMSPAAIIAGSTAIIALFSPVLRRRLIDMTGSNNQSLLKTKKHDASHHSQSHNQPVKTEKGTAQVSQMIKQAFAHEQSNQGTHQENKPSNQQHHKSSYAQPIHIDENVMNVLDDDSIQQVIGEIEGK
ncbi:spore coat protein [Bacillus sp. NPDC077027]|uniref:spore coat protein n=1 Tax=Bacillus sp. NPDC077027 TaxID=3390548 RepID=UPI003D06729F